MGEIILSQAGSAIGAHLLPNGLGVLGAQISGAALGGAIGSLAGRAIDTAFAPPMEGPRIRALPVMESRDGAPMANVYGRMRVGGQVIWASRFKEKRRERSAGKGGPKVADHTYSVSVAVAICDGPVTRLDRVWANGETLELSAYNWRFYDGRDDQFPDPLIEAVEGAGEAPAFRGTAYIVFEDLPLDAFGNRLPQLSFGAVRAASQADGLRSLVQGVNIIPASGEFVYGRDIVRARRWPGIEQPLNMNNAAGEADFMRSLGQLESDLPAVGSAALTVAWFGDDLRAGTARLRPGVETRDRVTVPYGWEVAGETRGEAYLVSQTGGSANYGGTPADRAVIEGIEAMKAQGLSVTLSPLILMDVPPGNGLPDPYGGTEQAAFPWRGRMTVSEDGTAAAREEIETFLGTDHDFGFRHFILHHARLAVEAGGVDAMMIGSEMVGLTRVRDAAGAFPFVEGLVQLAADVKAVVGSGTKVSYAADWTEYGAYVPAGGSGDVLFPLDALWASGDVDFVGVDWYPPAGDWRDGEVHLDAQAGHVAADDPAYLESQMAGGEAYDWYYASEADRDAQLRTPIADEAYAEHWVFRQKDLAGWWGAAHHERPGGARRETPTAWSPGLKPVRLMEIGFPAVDQGGNAPNLFIDPKSAESALPPYSSGERNDLFQRRALEAALGYWQAQACVEAAFVWAWDARPWPDFPLRGSVWSDGPNWTLGHWLNGRTGLIGLSEVVEDLASRAGLSVDASALDGFVEGFALDGPMGLRRALEPLRVLHGLSCAERETGLVFRHEGTAGLQLDATRLAEPAPSVTRTLLDKTPGRLQLTYIGADGQYGPATAEARSDEGEAGFALSATLPLVMSDGVASDLARRLLSAAAGSDIAELALPPEYLAVEPGDLLAGGGLEGSWLVGEMVDDGLLRRITLSRPSGDSSLQALALPQAAPAAPVQPAPELVLIDGPPVPGLIGAGPLAAVSCEPWRGAVSVSAGFDLASLTARAFAPSPARIGRLLAPLDAGPKARWDKSAAVDLEMEAAGLSSAEAGAVLAGANALLVEGDTGWELLCFAETSLEGAAHWRLSTLLRGLNGTPSDGAQEGAVCVLVDGALLQVAFSREETGLDLVWQAGRGDPVTFSHQARCISPWPVAHLQAAGTNAGGWTVNWLPCGPDIPSNWDLPDPTASRTYRVEAETSGVVTASETVTIPAIDLPAGPDLVRVAEVGADGRHGRWVSITLGGP